MPKVLIMVLLKIFPDRGDEHLLFTDALDYLHNINDMWKPSVSNLVASLTLINIHESGPLCIGHKYA